jgi:hypothetical protein
MGRNHDDNDQGRNHCDQDNEPAPAPRTRKVGSSGSMGRRALHPASICGAGEQWLKVNEENSHQS